MRYIVVRVTGQLWHVIDCQKSRVICQCAGFYGRRYAEKLAEILERDYREIDDLFMPREEDAQSVRD